MVGASGGGRGLEKALGPRQAMVREGLKWERYLRGVQVSYECETVTFLYVEKLDYFSRLVRLSPPPTEPLW